MSLILRTPTHADAAEIAAAEAETFRAPWLEASVKSAIARLDFCGVVAADGDGFCGYLLGSSLFETAEVSRIAVKKEKRGLGYGGKILDSFLAAVKTKGAERVFLEVRTSNIGAIALYQSRGFLPVRVRKKYYEDGEDALEMRKDLE